MAKPVNRAYTSYAREALVLLGNLVREGRQARRMTAGELAERAGISRPLLRRIEAGDPGCGIGAVFEVAAIVGIPLFEADSNTMSLMRANSTERKALLPKLVRTSVRSVKDDF